MESISPQYIKRREKFIAEGCLLKGVRHQNGKKNFELFINKTQTILLLTIFNDWSIKEEH